MISNSAFKRFGRVKALQVVSLARIKGKFLQSRAISITSRPQNWQDMKLRWAKQGNNVPIGWITGQHDDPERWTLTKEYSGSPEWGDKHDDMDFNCLYREDIGPMHLERFLCIFFGGIFWFHQFYQLYWNYEFLTGHFYIPYQTEFTDEELGIPPDDAPDPEYWGNHGKPFGTYR